MLFCFFCLRVITLSNCHRVGSAHGWGGFAVQWSRCAVGWCYQLIPVFRGDDVAVVGGLVGLLFRLLLGMRAISCLSDGWPQNPVVVAMWLLWIGDCQMHMIHKHKPHTHTHTHTHAHTTEQLHLAPRWSQQLPLTQQDCMLHLAPRQSQELPLYAVSDLFSKAHTPTQEINYVK